LTRGHIGLFQQHTRGPSLAANLLYTSCVETLEATKRNGVLVADSRAFGFRVSAAISTFIGNGMIGDVPRSC